MKKKHHLHIVLTILLFITFSVHAATHDEFIPKTVTSVGSQIFDAGGVNERVAAYFRVSEGWVHYPCAWGVMYFDPTTDAGQVWYKALLTAKAAGIKLSRVLYSSSNEYGADSCHITGLLELQ